MEDAGSSLLTYQTPILYATTAVVITAAALVFGYLYTQKQTAKDVSKETAMEKVANTTTPTSQKCKSTEKENSALTGKWPPGDEPDHLMESEQDQDDDEEDEEEEEQDPSKKVFEIPKDAPENVKRMLEMGFPGCPLFKRQDSDNPQAAVAMPGRIPLSQILGFPVEESQPPSSRKLVGAPKPVSALKRESNGKLTEKQKMSDGAQTATKKAGTCRKTDSLKTSKKESGKAIIRNKTQLKAKSTEVPKPDEEKTEMGDPNTAQEERDPVEFCSHLQREVKRTQQKVAIQKMEEDMTQEQKESEREIQRKQLENIFSMMQQQEDKFGINSMDDIQSQMKLYM